MYQSHKGWTSNSDNTIGRYVAMEYQSHKGWTSNSTTVVIMCINPTRGGRQTQYRHSSRSRPGSINPTRGGRQTSMWIYSSVAGAVYQSHKGWTSNLDVIVVKKPEPSINPTRGGRQTLLLNYPILHFIMYQSHKGWTSNWGWHVNCSRNGHVSIPQGVDVKLWWLRNRYRGRRCINPTRGGRQTTLHKRNGSPSQVSIPQGVDVKLSLCDLIVYYRQYQSHKGWTSNSPILALMLAF